MKPGLRPRFRLWAKLALFGVIGVAATHAVHLIVGSNIASDAVAHEQLARAEDLARLVALQVADAVLVDDQVSLQQTVQNATAGEHVAWCFVERDGRVLASSFPDATPPGLVRLRSFHSSAAPILVRNGDERYLDVAAPILGGSAGWVRVGIDAQVLQQTRHDLSVQLGLVALAAIGLGVVAAFVIGRSIARPVKDLLAAADNFDPSVGGTPIVAPGTDEFSEVAERFNQMMARLKAAHDEHQAHVRKSAASERLVALGSLVAGVAHEVNNPLAGIRNCQSALLWGELSASKQREYLELMGDALGRIEDIVRRLLDFGRPRLLTLRPEWPGSLATDTGNLVQPMLREKGVGWAQLDDGVGELKVLADRNQVGQALLNLVLNALYVTPKGGQIRLRLRRRPKLCGLSVEDDGPGIPVELRDRVLDPFFSTKREGEGTGLGLTVTRTIIDAHGGELAFEFPPGGGTVATVWLREHLTRP